MTLLKRKSALWHGRGYSPPGLGFRTPEDRSGSVSPPKREHIQPGCDARYLLGGVVGERGESERASERRWVGGRWWLEGSSLSQLSPQCSCIYHNSGGTIFTKPPTQCPDSKSRLKTSAESTLKGKRFSICDTTTALTLLFLSRSPTLWLDICQVCVKKERRPISPPPLFFSSSSPPPPPPLTLSLSLTCWQGGTVIITQAGFMESGPMAKTKRHLSIPVGNTLSARLLPLVLTASLGMHLSDT